MNLRGDVEKAILPRSGSPAHSGSLGTQPCMGDTQSFSSQKIRCSADMGTDTLELNERERMDLSRAFIMFCYICS